MTKEIAQLRVGSKKILYGNGAGHMLAGELKDKGINNIFICVDSGLSKSKLFSDFIADLKKADLNTEIYSDIHPNPMTEDIDRGAKLLRGGEFECVIGFGGGSSMDSAKMIAGLASNGGSIIEYTTHYEGKKSFIKKNYITVGIPTTSGTGSEMDDMACVVNEDGKKLNVFEETAQFDLIISDPEFTYSCPPKVTAACGIDAMCQALENYLGADDTPFSICTARAVKLAVDNLLGAYLGNNDLYKDRMAESSFLSGFGLVTSSAKGVPVHSIALPLAEEFHISHGESLAAVMPYVLDDILEANPTVMAKISRYVGNTGENDYVCAKLFCIQVQNLIRSMNLELSPDLKWDEDMINKLAGMAVMSRTTTGNGLFPFNYDMCRKIYRRSFEHDTILI